MQIVRKYRIAEKHAAEEVGVSNYRMYIHTH